MAVKHPRRKTDDDRFLQAQFGLIGASANPNTLGIRANVGKEAFPATVNRQPVRPEPGPHGALRRAFILRNAATGRVWKLLGRGPCALWTPSLEKTGSGSAFFLRKAGRGRYAALRATFRRCAGKRRAPRP